MFNCYDSLQKYIEYNFNLQYDELKNLVTNWLITSNAAKELTTNQKQMINDLMLSTFLNFKLSFNEQVLFIIKNLKINFDLTKYIISVIDTFTNNDILKKLKTEIPSDELNNVTQALFDSAIKFALTAYISAILAPILKLQLTQDQRNKILQGFYLEIISSDYIVDLLESNVYDQEELLILSNIIADSINHIDRSLIDKRKNLIQVTQNTIVDVSNTLNTLTQLNTGLITDYNSLKQSFNLDSALNQKSQIESQLSQLQEDYKSKTISQDEYNIQLNLLQSELNKTNELIKNIYDRLTKLSNLCSNLSNIDSDKLKSVSNNILKSLGVNTKPTKDISKFLIAIHESLNNDIEELDSDSILVSYLTSIKPTIDTVDIIVNQISNILIAEFKYKLSPYELEILTSKFSSILNSLKNQIIANTNNSINIISNFLNKSLSNSEKTAVSQIIQINLSLITSISDFNLIDISKKILSALNIDATEDNISQIKSTLLDKFKIKLIDITKQIDVSKTNVINTSNILESAKSIKTLDEYIADLNISKDLILNLNDAVKSIKNLVDSNIPVLPETLNLIIKDSRLPSTVNLEQIKIDFENNKSIDITLKLLSVVDEISRLRNVDLLNSKVSMNLIYSKLKLRLSDVELANLQNYLNQRNISASNSLSIKDIASIINDDVKINLNVIDMSNKSNIDPLTAATALTAAATTPINFKEIINDVTIEANSEISTEYTQTPKTYDDTINELKDSAELINITKTLSINEEELPNDLRNTELYKYFIDLETTEDFIIISNQGSVGIIIDQTLIPCKFNGGESVSQFINKFNEQAKAILNINEDRFFRYDTGIIVVSKLMTKNPQFRTLVVTTKGVTNILLNYVDEDKYPNYVTLIKFPHNIDETTRVDILFDDVEYSVAANPGDYPVDLAHIKLIQEFLHFESEYYRGYWNDLPDKIENIEVKVPSIYHITDDTLMIVSETSVNTTLIKNQIKPIVKINDKTPPILQPSALINFKNKSNYNSITIYPSTSIDKTSLFTLIFNDIEYSRVLQPSQYSINSFIEDFRNTLSNVIYSERSCIISDDAECSKEIPHIYITDDNSIEVTSDSIIQISNVFDVKNNLSDDVIPTLDSKVLNRLQLQIPDVLEANKSITIKDSNGNIIFDKSYDTSVTQDIIISDLKSTIIDLKSNPDGTFTIYIENEVSNISGLFSTKLPPVISNSQQEPSVLTSGYINPDKKITKDGTLTVQIDSFEISIDILKNSTLSDNISMINEKLQNLGIQTNIGFNDTAFQIISQDGSSNIQLTSDVIDLPRIIKKPIQSEPNISDVSPDENKSTNKSPDDILPINSNDNSKQSSITPGYAPKDSTPAVVDDDTFNNGSLDNYYAATNSAINEHHLNWKHYISRISYYADKLLNPPKVIAIGKIDDQFPKEYFNDYSNDILLDAGVLKKPFPIDGVPENSLDYLATQPIPPSKLDKYISAAENLDDALSSFNWRNLLPSWAKVDANGNIIVSKSFDLTNSVNRLNRLMNLNLNKVAQAYIDQALNDFTMRMLRTISKLLGKVMSKLTPAFRMMGKLNSIMNSVLKSGSGGSANFCSFGFSLPGLSVNLSYLMPALQYGLPSLDLKALVTSVLTALANAVQNVLAMLKAALAELWKMAKLLIKMAKELIIKAYKILIKSFGMDACHAISVAIQIMKIIRAAIQIIRAVSSAR